MNKKPLKKRGDIVVVLNVSHPENVEALFEYSAPKAQEENKSLLCLFSDQNSSMNSYTKNAMWDRVNEIKDKVARGVSLKLLIKEESPYELVEKHIRKAAMIVSDKGRMNPEKVWRYFVARNASCKMVNVEKKRSTRSFTLSKVIHSVERETISLEELQHWNKQNQHQELIDI